MSVTNSAEVARAMSLTGGRHRVFLPGGQNNADNRQTVGTLRGSYLFCSILPFRVDAVEKVGIRPRENFPRNAQNRENAD